MTLVSTWFQCLLPSQGIWKRKNKSKVSLHCRKHWIPQCTVFPGLPPVKWPLKGTNLDDNELLRPAGARSLVTANQAITQDSPGHPRSIPAQSQLKRARSMEGHQFPFKLKAILKSKQSRRGLRWFNGSYRQPVWLKMEAEPLRVMFVELPIRHVKSLRQSKSVRKKRVQVILQAVWSCFPGYNCSENYSVMPALGKCDILWLFLHLIWFFFLGWRTFNVFRCSFC